MQAAIEHNKAIVRLTNGRDSLDEEDVVFLVDWVMLDLFVLAKKIYSLFTREIVEKRIREKLWEEVLLLRGK